MVAGAAAGVFGCRRALSVAVSRAHRQDFAIPVLCDGTLEPGAGGEIRASQPATVIGIAVRGGARVAAGEILVKLSNPDLAQRAREARSEASGIAAEGESSQAEAAALATEVERLRRTAEADERLLREGAITREQRDGDADALRDARARLRAAEAKSNAILRRGPGSRSALAERSAVELERQVADLTVRAPSAGIVYGLPRREGERVEAGQVIASIADPGRRRVRVRVDEPDLPRIAVGQPLTVTFDGLPGRQWKGQVAQVASELRDESGRRTGDVIGEITDPGALLPGNASVNVAIVTAARHGALVIPRSAVLRNGALRFVYVLDSGRARRREVSVGLLGATEVEVTAGLAEGERVIIPSAAPLADGTRVSVSG